jgi:hypothetical protein
MLEPQEYYVSRSYLSQIRTVRIEEGKELVPCPLVSHGENSNKNMGSRPPVY